MDLNCPVSGIFLYGFALAIILITFWSWVLESYPDMEWRDFWQPITNVAMHNRAWWRVHVLPHLLGGILLAAVVRGPWFAASVREHFGSRFLAVLVFQGLWERIQHENWRPRPGLPSTYPWWSAVGDVVLTLVGFGIVEGWLALIW